MCGVYRCGVAAALMLCRLLRVRVVAAWWVVALVLGIIVALLFLRCVLAFVVLFRDSNPCHCHPRCAVICLVVIVVVGRLRCYS